MSATDTLPVKNDSLLLSVVPESTLKQWLEASPEALRQIINEYARHERSA